MQQPTVYRFYFEDDHQLRQSDGTIVHDELEGDEPKRLALFLASGYFTGATVWSTEGMYREPGEIDVSFEDSAVLEVVTGSAPNMAFALADDLRRVFKQNAVLVTWHPLRGASLVREGDEVLNIR